MRARVGSSFMPLAFASVLGPTLSCDATEDATQAARAASQRAVDASKDKAATLAEDATALGQEASAASRRAAREATDDAVDASKEAVRDATQATRASIRSLVDGLRSDGALSQTATRWISERAQDVAATDIVSIVNTGVQLVPVAIEAGRVLAKAVDSNTVIEPIIQALDDDPATVDAAIADMPRVEVIDGVTVGFEQMEHLDATQQIKQRGVLVMWRTQDHLVGFVYRSTRTIDLETLVAETPRMLALTQRALSQPTDE